MDIVDKEEIPRRSSIVSRYLCNARFFAFAIVSVLIIIGSLYFSLLFDFDDDVVKTPTVTSKPVGPTNNNISVPENSKWHENEEIQIFREYLRIPSVHPDVDYEPCVEFLRKQAASLDLPLSVYYPANDKNPVVVITWEGWRPELPAILLNSHMDVVPVFEEYWTHSPFAAEIDENGDIYARGAQDMKSVGMQYLGAIRSLKQSGVQRLNRTVHVIYVPDEEVGGGHGMKAFVQTEAFKSLNAAFVLDEGAVASDDKGTMPIFYAEKTSWQIEFIFHGQSGHGSILFENTPGEKLNYVVGKFTQFRKEEMRKLYALNYPVGNVTSINLTVLKGGVENNVIPAELSATFDIRISINADQDEFEQMINQWCDEAGGNITIKWLHRGEKGNITPVDNSNPFWIALKNATEEAGLTVKATVLGPSSDMVYIRKLNIYALGFSPLINTTVKMHDHNEYLNANVYLTGIDIYTRIIRNLGYA